MPGGKILKINETLKLPGVGFTITSGEPEPDQGDGVAGYMGRANKGPLGVPVRCYSRAHLERVYGPLGTSGNTMDGANEAFLGGASAVDVIRLGGTGAPAAKATITIQNATPAPALKVDAKDYGTDGSLISVTLRTNAADGTKKDFVVLVSGVQKEVFTHTPAADQPAAIVAAVAAQGSEFVAVTALAAGVLPDATTALAGGANPTIVNNDYGTALAALGPRQWRAVASDSELPAVHTIIKAAVDDLIMKGRRRLAVVGEPVTVTWATRLANCKALNDPAVVYVGTAFDRTTGTGTTPVEGYRAAGREAGRHSTLRLGRQLTHNRIPDAVATREAVAGVSTSGAMLTDDQLIEAQAAGMYVYTVNDDGTSVMTNDGLTTFYNPVTPPIWAESADPGWIKSRLVLTRFRLFDDIDRAWEPMVENTSNTGVGLASVVRTAKNVIDSKYVPAEAVSEYTLVPSVADPAKDDHATFELDAVTPDGLTKLKLVAKFRR